MNTVLINNISLSSLKLDNEIDNISKYALDLAAHIKTRELLEKWLIPVPAIRKNNRIVLQYDDENGTHDIVLSPNISANTCDLLLIQNKISIYSQGRIQNIRLVEKSNQHT